MLGALARVWPFFLPLTLSVAGFMCTSIQWRGARRPDQFQKPGGQTLESCAGMLCCLLQVNRLEAFAPTHSIATDDLIPNYITTTNRNSNMQLELFFPQANVCQKPARFGAVRLL